MTGQEALAAAGIAAMRAASAGERVSLLWTWPGMSVTFNWQHGAWFWVAHDSRADRTAGCGQAATIAAAVAQARAAAQPPLAAE